MYLVTFARMPAGKKKLINDPVYGFVSIPDGLLFSLVEHRWFQRLRRIKQLGLSNLVYPGAQHVRFQHVLGAMWLCQQALETLRSKGIAISEEEETAVCAAVLLHDMGHGPFSHTLEGVFVQGLSHEALSIHLMKKLNASFNGALDLAIKIFNNEYPRRFLHQLVSSQLDMDRMDYLRRDSFYTGVQEGIIGHDRIINMLHVHRDELVVEEKGIYSVEKFLVARRIMYWQVYLHKTVVAAESLLLKIMERARYLAYHKEELFCTPALGYFLYNDVNAENFFDTEQGLINFCQLDDEDVLSAIKVWCHHQDSILSELCSMLTQRRLPRIEIAHERFEQSRLESLKHAFAQKLNISTDDSSYFIFSDSVKNRAYTMDDFNIQILYKNAEVKDIARASDNYNIEALSKTVTKYFLCYPKELRNL